jgi:hypothetical protein
VTWVVFLTTVIYWPGVVEVANTPRWALLSLALPLLLLRARPRLTLAGELGLVFLLFALASLAWTPGLWDGVERLWHFVVLAMMFALGTAADTKRWRSVLAAFAAGMAVNGLIALAQLHLDLLPIAAQIPAVNQPSGTFVNFAFLAAAGLLGLVVCLAQRRWLLLPLCGLAAFLPLSRGVLLAAIVTAGWWLCRRLDWARGLLLAVLAAWVLREAFPHIAGMQSVAMRASLYQDTLLGLLRAPLYGLGGWGAGSYDSIYPLISTATDPTLWSYFISPGNPHSDPLLLLSEFGLVALLPFTLAALCLRSAPDDARAILIAFLVIGLVAFPLLDPASAGLAAFAAGYGAVAGRAGGQPAAADGSVLVGAARALGAAFVAGRAARLRDDLRGELGMGGDDLSRRAEGGAGDVEPHPGGAARRSGVPGEPHIRQLAAIAPASMNLDPIVALAFIRRGLSHAPDDPHLHYWKGVQHLRAGDFPSAEDEAALLRRLVPQWPQTVQLETLIKDFKP